MSDQVGNQNFVFLTSRLIYIKRPKTVQFCSMPELKSAAEYRWMPIYLDLYYIFIEIIMRDAVEKHTGSVSIRSRIFINTRFADDIVVIADEEAYVKR